jgi:hypothetical protein
MTIRSSAGRGSGSWPASDGGFVCYSRDDRARVDTTSAQDWIRETIAEVLQR